MYTILLLDLNSFWRLNIGSSWIIYKDQYLAGNDNFIFGDKTNLSESGVLCGNTAVFGLAQDDMSLQGESDLPLPRWSNIAIKYTRQRLFCFYILLFNGLLHFKLRHIYEKNMCLLLYLSVKISVGIHPTATKMLSKQHYNAIHVTS